MDVSSAGAFFIEPYTRNEWRFQITGAALHGLVWLAGLVWLVRHWPSWPQVVVGIFAGVYAADLVSGLLHWAFDTWFDESMTFVRRMVVQVREHHVYPNRIFRYPFFDNAGTLSWIALGVTAPILVSAFVFDAPTAILGCLVFGVLLATMLTFHKIGHRGRQPRWIRLLQKSGLLISTAHHSQHHGGNHDFNYCLINGWADQTLGRAGLFRALEWVIARATGAQPRRNDHEWIRRFGADHDEVF